MSRFLLSLLLMLMIHYAASFSSSGPQMADLNILLPPKMTYPVEYKLQGSGGCFRWSWDHHDILSVLPEYINSTIGCSTSARLKSIAPYDGRKETAVYATDKNTGIVIRCKVYIDVISRIQIFHNSVKLDLEGLATLRVQAFDSEENVFSSLVGLQFMWELRPETDGLDNHVVHVPLKDSPWSDCGGLCCDLDIQVNLEENGVYSDFYVVKGNRIGREIISVHLLEPSFDHFGDKIVLTVAEPMYLDPPSPVNVLIGSVFSYALTIVRNNTPSVVYLPSPFHQWSVLNSSVAQVDRELGTIHALNLGATTIVIEDIRVNGHVQISSLHVFLPDSLLLYMTPLTPSGDPVEGVDPIPSLSPWYVVSGRLYFIHVKVFSSGVTPEEIYLTETNEIELHDNHNGFWNVFPVSEGGIARKNYRILQANSYGSGKIKATLTYSTGHDRRNEVLKVVQEVKVCDQVKFNMKGESGVSKRILLPWLPGVYQELELRATGGCAMSSSDYKWFSKDMAVVTVSVFGIVQARNPGKTIIRAVSIFDSLNYDEMVVEVSIPSLMVMLPYFPLETPVGSHLKASVTLKTSSGFYFDACEALRSTIRWQTDNESFVIINATTELLVSDSQEVFDVHSSSHGPPCAWTHIYASHSGSTMVHATMTREYQQYAQTSCGSVILEASYKISAYLPLIVHQAGDGNQYGGYGLARAKTRRAVSNLDCLYLAPGTQLVVKLSGGPERRGPNVEFLEAVEILDRQNPNMKDFFIHKMSKSYYRIGCENLGTFKLVFMRGNVDAEDHRFSAVARVNLMLLCKFPSSIVIIADKALNAPSVVQSAVQADRLPGGIQASPITVANGRRIRISAVGISHSGKAFANSSSLSVRWEITECSGLVVLDDAYNSSTAKSSWEIFLILQNASTLCVVRSTVVGLIESLSNHAFTHLSGISTSNLTDAIQLQLVSPPRLYPEFGFLFFSPNARLKISIVGGSCSLDTLVNDTQILEVIPQLPAYQCSLLVLAPKSLGTALVTVHDIGLVPPLTASSIVQVADVEWIKILKDEHISIVEGSVHSVTFSVGVGDGHSFDSSQYIYMEIYVHIEKHIIQVVENFDFQKVADKHVHAPEFTVQATRLGVTTIYLSMVQHSGHVIMSRPIKVEVYAAPRIHPSDIFLVPGASYVLTISGGPKMDSHVEYSSTDNQTAKVHKLSGQVSAISPGNSTIVATIYGYADIMLCQAYGYVKVGIPSSAVLNVQSGQLAVGRKMSIYPSLSDGNLFSFYECCNDFKWSVEDNGVLNVQETHGRGSKHSMVTKSQPTGYKDDLDIIRVLQGISPGTTTITVSFSCDFKFTKLSLKSMFYHASLSLWVVHDLPLSLGSVITWILPPYYTTSDLLPSFSHDYGRGDSLSDKDRITYSLLGPCTRKTDDMPDEYIYINGAKVITKDSGNLACIQAKDMSTGRAEVSSCVKVAEVAQIRIMTDEFPVHVVAVGAELDLPIKYHDTLGNPFHEAYNITLFEAVTNYPDIVSIDPYDGHGNIHLRARSHGIALVQIAFISNIQISEYAIISVGPQLYPQNPVLYKGSVLKFTVKGLASPESGQWFSANESIVHVDMLSGKAEGIEEGTTNIYFEGSSLKLHTAATVLKGNVVSLPATDQRVKIDVSYEPKEENAVVRVTNVSLWPHVVGLVFLLILTVLVIFRLSRPGRLQPPVMPGNPGVAAPITPERSSPLVINDQSPGTPKAFIDYVRSTIDETPYYRQDFRRRVNPQNTI